MDLLCSLSLQGDEINALPHVEPGIYISRSRSCQPVKTVKALKEIYSHAFFPLFAVEFHIIDSFVMSLSHVVWLLARCVMFLA